MFFYDLQLLKKVYLNKVLDPKSGFDVVYMGSPAIKTLCSYIIYFNHFNNYNHIGVATLRGRGAAVPV